MNRSPPLLVGTAVVAAVLLGAAFYLLRDPYDDPSRLLAALDAFTGEWEGDASIQSSDGIPLQTVRMTRRYSWVGEKQIVETRLTDRTTEHSTRTIQWIEDGRLKAVGLGPADEANEFTGAPTADGILWTNLSRPKADRLDRLVTQDGQKTVQSASISPLQLGAISDILGVAAVLLPRTDDEVSAAAATETTTDLVTRVTDLERKLIAAELERDRLRTRLEFARAVEAKARNPDESNATVSTSAAGTGQSLRPNQFEIRSSPPGMKFEVRREDEVNLTGSSPLFAGTTPITLPAVPPGNYAVILQREGQRKTVHHVTVREFTNVFLFHREEGTATRPPDESPDDLSSSQVLRPIPIEPELVASP